MVSLCYLSVQSITCRVVLHTYIRIQLQSLRAFVRIISKPNTLNKLADIVNWNAVSADDASAVARHTGCFKARSKPAEGR